MPKEEGEGRVREARRWKRERRGWGRGGRVIGIRRQCLHKDNDEKERKEDGPRRVRVGNISLHYGFQGNL